MIEQTLRSNFRGLRFPASLEARYTKDTRAERIAALQVAGLALAVLMNLFLVSDHAMVPDMFEQALRWRLWVYGPAVLLSLWFLARIKRVLWRELFVAQAGLLATAIHMALCLNSHSPHAQAYLAGLAMVIFFTNVYSKIRLWSALVLNAVYLCMYGVTVWWMPLVDWNLMLPTTLVLLSTTLFTLYYVYTLEHEDRHNYLLSQRQKALSMQLLQANEELERVSRTDALTQVANRRHFDEFLGQLWERSRVDDQPVSIVMLDVDHFKLFNDRYGHPEGDACLVAVAQEMRQALRRPGDLVARYGGEEFIAVLSKAASEQAQQAGERVRSVIEALQIVHEGSPLYGRVTVSVGLATLRPSDPDASLHRLIALADGALYQAKSRGRNSIWPLLTKKDAQP